MLFASTSGWSLRELRPALRQVRERGLRLRQVAMAHQQRHDSSRGAAATRSRTCDGSARRDAWRRAGHRPRLRTRRSRPRRPSVAAPTTTRATPASTNAPQLRTARRANSARVREHPRRTIRARQRALPGPPPWALPCAAPARLPIADVRRRPATHNAVVSSSDSGAGRVSAIRNACSATRAGRRASFSTSSVGGSNASSTSAASSPDPRPLPSGGRPDSGPSGKQPSRGAVLHSPASGGRPSS